MHISEQEVRQGWTVERRKPTVIFSIDIKAIWLDFMKLLQQYTVFGNVKLNNVDEQVACSVLMIHDDEYSFFQMFTLLSYKCSQAC